MPIYRLLQVGLPRTQFVHTVDKSVRFTDDDGCSADMTLHRVESLGPDKPGFEPNFQSSDILAGTVGGALLLLSPWSRSLLGVFCLSYQCGSPFTKGPSTTRSYMRPRTFPCRPVVSLLITYVAWYSLMELKSTSST